MHGNPKPSTPQTLNPRCLRISGPRRRLHGCRHGSEIEGAWNCWKGRGRLFLFLIGGIWLVGFRVYGGLAWGFSFIRVWQHPKLEAGTFQRRHPKPKNFISETGACNPEAPSLRACQRKRRAQTLNAKPSNISPRLRSPKRP